MRTTNVPLFTDFTMDQDGYSAPFDLEMVTGYSIQATWTGTPTCYLFLQVSNDASKTPTNWTLMDLSICPTGGSANDLLYKQHQAAFRWIRLGCAFGSGTGTLNARISCKGTGQ